MRIGDLSGGAAQLNDSLDTLRAAWAETETRWNDAASRRLYKERLDYIDEFFETIEDRLETARRKFVSGSAGTAQIRMVPQHVLPARRRAA